MANIAGTNLAAGIVPFTTEDQYATHFAGYGKGGWHSVATIEERDAIPAQRMEVGMVAFVVAEQRAYTLTSVSPLTWEALAANPTETVEEATEEEINGLFN